MNNVELYYTNPEKFFKRVPISRYNTNLMKYKTRQRQRTGQGIPPPTDPCLVHLIIKGHAKCNLGVSGIQAQANNPDPTEHFSGYKVLCKTHYDEVNQKGGRRTQKKIDRSSRRRRKSNVTRRSL